MSIENNPEPIENAMDIFAKAGYVKAENDKISISLDSANTLSIQPKGTIFGMKVKVEQDDTLTPSLTIDTKKLRDTRRYTPPEKLLDQAIENFLKNSNV
jgi:hypothetical protein